jgi:hypothetical protein
MSDTPSTSWATWAWQAYREGRLTEADTVQAQIDAAVTAERARCARATVLAGERSAGMPSSYVVDAISAAIRKGDQS